MAFIIPVFRATYLFRVVKGFYYFLLLRLNICFLFRAFIISCFRATSLFFSTTSPRQRTASSQKRNSTQKTQVPMRISLITVSDFFFNTNIFFLFKMILMKIVDSCSKFTQLTIKLSYGLFQAQKFSSAFNIVHRWI